MIPPRKRNLIQRTVLLTLGIIALAPTPFSFGAFSSHPDWLRLLHYKSNWLGQSRSLVDNPQFFLSPHGKYDPQAEWESDLQAFQDLNSPAQCQFPARYRFIKRELGLAIRDIPCPELEAWKSALAVESVTLVFSSAYAHAPASIFGHTFLRLNRKSLPNQKKIDLLDYGVNFAANTQGAENGNPVSYAWNGLLGGYPGYFSLAPYYTKINEYTFVESRDLWEFELHLSQEEIDRLVNHLWELLHFSHFDYFYLDENCSYQLLSLLEVSNPEWDLTNFWIYALPLDTVQRVAEYQSILRVKHRPSLKKILMDQVNSLRRNDHQRFKAIAFDLKNPTPEDSAQTLAAVNSYFFYKKQRNRGELTPDQSRVLKSSLLARSKIQTHDETFSSPEPEPAPIPSLSPLQGHRPIRASLWGGIRDQNAFSEVRLRGGIHDLLNSELGYTEFSQIEIFDLHLRSYFKKSQIRVENFEIFNAISFFPWDSLEQLPSWKMSLRYTTPRDLCSSDCHAWQFSGGIGMSAYLFSRHSIIALLATSRIEAIPGKVPLRGGPGAEAFSLLNWEASQKISLSAQLQTDLFQTQRSKYDWKFEGGYSYSLSSHWEARGTANYRFSPAPQKNSSQELGLGLSYFF